MGTGLKCSLMYRKARVSRLDMHFFDLESHQGLAVSSRESWSELVSKGPVPSIGPVLPMNSNGQLKLRQCAVVARRRPDSNTHCASTWLVSCDSFNFHNDANGS